MTGIDEHERPAVWVGHISVAATDVAASAAFYRTLGMRDVVDRPDLAILELRGGTHLVVNQGDVTETTGFDLMVDDVAASHATWSEAGLDPSPIETGRIHQSFTMTDPAGTVVTVYSSHVIGTV